MQSLGKFAITRSRSTFRKKCINQKKTISFDIQIQSHPGANPSAVNGRFEQVFDKVLLRSTTLLRRYFISAGGSSHHHHDVVSLLFYFIFIRFKLILQVRARIEVSVINFLKILNSPEPAISDLPLVLHFSFVW